MAFSEGVTDKRLVGKLERHNIETITELFFLVNKCAREAEAQSCTEWRNAPEEPASQEHSRLDNKKNKQKAVAVLVTEGRNKPPTGRNPGRGPQKPAPAVASKWCEIHKTDRHDLTECRFVKGLAENHQKEQGEHRHDGDDENAPSGMGLGFQEPRQAVATVFGLASAPPSRRRAKLL
jgi:hypothetical protein